MNKIINVFLIMLLVVSGCKKDDDDPAANNNNNSTSTTIAQDKQNISNSFASMENCINSLKNGFGAEALQNFLNLDEGDVLSENWIEDMTENIDDLLNWSVTNKIDVIDWR